MLMDITFILLKLSWRAILGEYRPEVLTVRTFSEAHRKKTEDRCSSGTVQ